MMKIKVIAWFFAAVFVLAQPVSLMAQDEESDKVYDARLEGYTEEVGSRTLDSRSTALQWMLLIFLAAVCVGVMFKSSKRTHLD